jgi:hypothetical protein
VAGKISSIEKSNGLIGNQTRNLPAYSIVPESSTLPRDPQWCYNNLYYSPGTVRVVIL